MKEKIDLFYVYEEEDQYTVIDLNEDNLILYNEVEEYRQKS